jgi:hypothetical protein
MLEFLAMYTMLETTTLMLLMSCVPDSPASPSASPEIRMEKAIPATSGPNSTGLSVKSVPASFFLRTSAIFDVSLMGLSLTAYSASLPKSGTMQNGIVFERRTQALRTFENAFSLWPTPAASDNLNREPGTPHLTKNGTIRHVNPEGEQSFMRLSQVVKMWSTPQARDWKNPDAPNSGRAKRKTAQGWTQELNNQVRMWSTPAAQDGKNLTLPASPATRDTLPGDMLRNQHSGYMNPAWEATLMGFPPDWLDINFLPDKASSSMTTNRRAPSVKKKRGTKRKSEPSETP